MRSVLILVFLAITVSLKLNAQDSVKTRFPDFSKLDKYENLLARAKAMDTTLDFFELRMSFTQTPDYSPYGLGMSSNETTRSAYKELNAGNLEKAEEYARQALSIYYLNLKVHMLMYYIKTEQKDIEAANYHNFFVKGLLKSIFESGNGLSPESAWIVIEVSEEYAALNAMNMEIKSQALITSDYGPMDKMKVISNGQDKEFYFNIALPFKTMSKMFENK